VWANESDGVRKRTWNTATSVDGVEVDVFPSLLLLELCEYCFIVISPRQLKLVAHKRFASTFSMEPECSALTYIVSDIKYLF
jgi:hypothetical protein